ncbi:MAG: hypothetical protein ACKVRN_13340 [Pyrinomonadaceae bacterium]
MATPAQGNDWFPGRLPEQAEMFANVKGKIANYTAILPLTAPQVTQITLICNEFNAVYNYVAQVRSTAEAIVEWRKLIFKGVPTGSAAPSPPVFPAYGPVLGSVIGIFTQFRDLVEIIKASPGYTRAIGEDLMIVRPATEAPSAGSVTPELKIKGVSGNTVEIMSSLQGLDAMRIEYIKDGTSAWNIKAFLTSLPANVTIGLAVPGQPETGRIRAILIEKNEDFGNYSPEYPVTLS